MQSSEKIGIKMFFRIRPVEVLLGLRDGPKYATVISRENNCTYSHTVKLIKDFKKMGLVDFEKKGRIKLVKLTEDGQNIANSLYSLMNKLSRIKHKV
jgi:DNA-binding MarR family transcriptional regulator